jgi:hypothetical protein
MTHLISGVNGPTSMAFDFCAGFLKNRALASRGYFGVRHVGADRVTISYPMIEAGPTLSAPP